MSPENFASLKAIFGEPTDIGMTYAEFTCLDKCCILVVSTLTDMTDGKPVAWWVHKEEKD